ncbi:MAG TPA: aminotransferase class I/II-fold pyridoxal phosphate-dependent enzyme, partial [Lachnospiraceae bacterium]|nr:aminotransferase class I/II-fold pyridoxal phosphate-dependent enzyme [Lachnospiraceae bacterium]
MIKHKDHFHGSDLEAIEQTYGIRKEAITSFSANVNPLGVSPKLREGLAAHIDAITTYPDREYTSLRKCIGDYVGTDFSNVIVGNGSTELISLMIQIKAPKKALIIGPTYSEYEREVSLGGGSSHYFPLKENENFSLDKEKL